MNNRIQLMGCIDADPVVTSFDDTPLVARAAINTSEVLLVDGATIIETQQHRLVGVGAYAMEMMKKLKRGSRVCIIGALRHHRTTLLSKQVRFITDILVKEIIDLTDERVI